MAGIRFSHSISKGCRYEKESIRSDREASCGDRSLSGTRIGDGQGTR